MALILNNKINKVKEIEIMIEYFSTNDPPKTIKLNINELINSKIITSNHIRCYMTSDNNLTSFIVKEDIV